MSPRSAPSGGRARGQRPELVGATPAHSPPWTSFDVRTASPRPCGPPPVGKPRRCAVKRAGPIAGHSSSFVRLSDGSEPGVPEGSRREGRASEREMIALLPAQRLVAALPPAGRQLASAPSACLSASRIPCARGSPCTSRPASGRRVGPDRRPARRSRRHVPRGARARRRWHESTPCPRRRARKRSASPPAPTATPRRWLVSG
jgi:hypothetical protein